MFGASVLFCTGVKHRYRIKLTYIEFVTLNRIGRTVCISCATVILFCTENKRKYGRNVAGSKIKIGSFCFLLSMFPSLSQSP
jgi:hypothetical protein